MVSLGSSSSESSGIERQYREIYGEIVPPPADSTRGLGYVPTVCGCGMFIKAQTSWTTTNPGRRFVQCPKRRQSVRGMQVGCGMWDWVDNKFDAQAEAVINDLVRTKRELLNVRGELEWAVRMKEVEIQNLKLRRTTWSGNTGAAGNEPEPAKKSESVDGGMNLEDIIKARDLKNEFMMQKTMMRQNFVLGFSVVLLLFTALLQIIRK